MKTDLSRVGVLAEVGVVTAVYLAVTRLSISAINLTWILPRSLSADETRIGGIFLVGALAQLVFVGMSVPVSAEFRRAVRATFQAAPRRAAMAT